MHTEIMRTWSKMDKGGQKYQINERHHNQTPHPMMAVFGEQSLGHCQDEDLDTS
jgi:hypothetical protein